MSLFLQAGKNGGKLDVTGTSLQGRRRPEAQDFHTHKRLCRDQVKPSSEQAPQAKLEKRPLDVSTQSPRLASTQAANTLGTKSDKTNPQPPRPATPSKAQTLPQRKAGALHKYQLNADLQLQATFFDLALRIVC